MISTLRDRGLTVAVLGPDGSGKSTVLSALEESLPPGFTTARIIHFRPRVGLRTGEEIAVTDPHGKERRNSLVSTLKLLYYLGDCLLGHLLIVRPALHKGELVLFDRYLADLLVDPRRYRYGGPRWLARLATRLNPSPDLVLLLDAPAAVLESRKQEVAFSEMERQRAAYTSMVGTMPFGRILNASTSVSEVALEAQRLVLEAQASMKGTRS